MKLLHVMSFIIERMKFSIRPCAPALTGYLPALWQESADHNMLRCAILTTLTNLVLVRHRQRRHALTPCEHSVHAF